MELLQSGLIILTLALALALTSLPLLRRVLAVAVVGRDASRGVPSPSVFMVSTLLARERLTLRAEILEGARPKSWRFRRPRVEDSVRRRGGGFESSRW